MKKFSVLIVGIFVLLLSAQTALATATVGQAEIMIFTGQGCPHCAVVEEYLEENDIYSKLDVKVYEVYYSEENKELYFQKTQEVGYEGGGVPFLANGDEYTVGDSPIIAYLEGLLENSAAESGLASVLDTLELDTPEEEVIDSPDPETKDTPEEEIIDPLYDPEIALDVETSEGIIQTIAKNSSLGILGIIIILGVIFYVVKRR